MMAFELWDVGSGNIIRAYEREEEALALVRASIVAYGLDYANDLLLLEDAGRGDLITVASGQSRARRAIAASVVGTR